jgi:3-oxoacyl-[acyl-carrier protein] reductase
MDLQLQDRHVAVVGAGGVLGQAIARGLAAEGARLSLFSRDASSLAPLADALRALGSPRVITLDCDLGDEAAVGTAIAAADGRSAADGGQGPIDSLVCAAGAAQGGVFWELDDAAWRDSLEVKLFGTLRVLRAITPRMVARRAGRIVLVVGNSARQPEPRMLPGAAANAALLAVVRGLAEELGPHGVALNAVNPGPVRSARWDRLMQAAAAREAITAAEAERRFLEKTALRRLATPEEIAQHVVFLASPTAAHLTGTSVTVDGGSTKSP